ncbi:AraC family transcriptional regulator [Dyadobacter sp. CY323]|uniref:helix-turn-helix transcriptional regulator n=1 Tax=Dyadobacter sp. CY323 TaxID=2907302 RepID=UPI001F35FD66|nr:AraC family transcriptional regulator [Dyadobacter sp. CY323]MCE6991500.1 AraC family transcriptional regulator [Dyadobacter sp. CY323]
MKEDILPTVPSVLIELAHRLGTEVKNHRLDIPETSGTGYCAGFVFNEYIRMMIFSYELYEDLVIDNPEVDTMRRMILFKFQNVIPTTNSISTGKEIPSVLIVTSRVNPDLVIPIQRNRAMINIEVDANYLRGLFDLSEKSTVLQSLLENTQPLFFEEIVFPSLQTLVDELVSEVVDKTFALFFRRVKTEELICRLLMALERRDKLQLYALNSQDIRTIYRIKEQMLDCLDTPPVINDLAESAHMSPTKLKRLFRQIFGDSIFSYYQAFRINEAARLLKAEKLSVSEVGHQMGFDNLSHFSRVFEKQIGIKPKKFSVMKRVR